MEEFGTTTPRPSRLLAEGLALFALAAAYAVLILITAQPDPQLDEARNVMLARNLARGFYSPPGKIYLPSGPGYPMLLAPIAWLALPDLTAKLLNSLLLAGAVLHFHRSLGRFASARTAWIAAACFALYGPNLRFLPLLMSEILAVFLVAGSLDHLTASVRTAGRSQSLHRALAVIHLAALALTKALFAYVIVANIVILGVLAVRRPALRALVACYAMALMLCAPYLAYTWNLTGRAFYWMGQGVTLYWMSAPGADELGDYIITSGRSQRDWERPDCAARVIGRHQEFFAEIDPLPEPEREDRIRRRAIENILDHPGRYARNWLLNLGRLTINYPYSCSAQSPRTFLYLLWGGTLLFLLSVAAFLTAFGYVSLAPDLALALLFGGIAFGASSLLSAHHRHMLPLIPIAGVWVAVTLEWLFERLRQPG